MPERITPILLSVHDAPDIEGGTAESILELEALESELAGTVAGPRGAGA